MPLTCRIVPGLSRARALLAQNDGTLYLGRHYRVYRSTDDGASWTCVTSIPRSPARRFAEMFSPACRLLRHEIKALGVLPDGTCVAATRGGVYYAAPGQTAMSPSRVDEGGQALSPPMTITVGPGNRVLWGEYNSAYRHNQPIRIYASDDGARTHQVVRVFDRGDILHVHNVVYDEARRHYWVLTGDHGNEPGIGRLSLDLRDFEWVARGEQSFRTVAVFDFGEYLVYGTDSEREANAVMRFEKSTGRVERLQELDGSCIYACRFGGLYVLSTTVEPSVVNVSRQASLWVSRDGDSWRRVFQAQKDRWPAVYFQYGSLVLPRGASDREVILFTGQALEDIDGRAVIATLHSEDCRESGAPGSPSDTRQPEGPSFR
jgi:hypothetical protein